LHRGNRVAGIDRTLEGVGAVIHLGDVADLGHVQLGGHARRHILAARGGGEQDVAVVRTGNRQHLGGDVFGQAVRELLAVGVDDLGNAGDLGCGLAGFGGIGTGHQHMDVTATGKALRSRY
jgi:hypothetical protein